MHDAGRDEQPDRQCAGPACAESQWVNQNKTNGLVVEQNGTCGFLVNGRPKWSGTCKWETPSAKGGILDLQYPMPLAPGHIRWSVIYINKTTITLDGEAFYKQGN